MKWLLDEMLPHALALRLEELGHDALTVVDSGLAGSTDEDVFSLAFTEERVLVTENFADFAMLLRRRMASNEPCVPVVFVRKSDFPRRGGLVPHLGALLDQWAREHPDPYIGLHWP